MTNIDTRLIPEFLSGRRWFGGKGVPIKSVHVLEHVTLDEQGNRREAGEGMTLVVLEVVYEVGQPERYLAPLMITGDGKLREGLDEDALARALLTIVREQKSVPTGGGLMRGEMLDGGGALREVSPEPAVRRIAAEQSNTSLVYDDKVILKLIRKIDLGYNPEWEMGQFLRKNGYRHTPPLLGGVVLEGAVHSTVAVVHEFVPVDADGWSWMLGELVRPEPHARFLEEIRGLGARLGELHTVLASDDSDPAFAPEPIMTEDLQRWASSIIGELGVSIAMASARVPELARRRDELIEHINRLARMPPSGLKTRHHGDLHLGQTLRSRGEWLIFDFEGEPARTYAQRREKHSPLRDVAGMLRSFAYACATVELQGAPEAERLRPMREAFLDAYRRAVTHPGLLPESEETFDVLLGTLELEKLLYELRYEVSHRPDWVRIPARTLLEIQS